MIDPTENVLQLVEAQVKRLDDLSSLYEKRVTDLQVANDRLLDLRDRRQDDLRTIETAHLKYVADMRAQYEQKLAEKESERLDAIRAVDVGNVSRAAEVSAAQASTLATQVQTSAETLRTQAATFAQQVAANLAQTLEPIQSDIRDLRKTQSEQIGAKERGSEGRSTNQWVIGLAFGIIILIVDKFQPLLDATPPDVKHAIEAANQEAEDVAAIKAMIARNDAQSSDASASDPAASSSNGHRV